MTYTNTSIWTPRHQLASDVSPGRTLLCPPEPRPARAPEPRNPWLVYPEDLEEKLSATNPIPVESSALSNSVNALAADPQTLSPAAPPPNR